jgi:hypothetical protein
VTEVIHVNKPKENKSRSPLIIDEYHCVEMKLTKALPVYLFKLHPPLDLNGAYVLIKDNSEIVKHLKLGRMVDMVHYSKRDDDPASKFRSQISDISKIDQGPLKGHIKIGLSIEA